MVRQILKCHIRESLWTLGYPARLTKTGTTDPKEWFQWRHNARVGNLMMRSELHVNTTSIIAVHGLQTTAAKTWTAYKNGKNAEGGECHWLRDEDMLPKVLPQARIWAFDYNSNYSSNAQHVSIVDLGQVLLDMVHGKKDDQLGERTLVFIGSCFGGIIVAQV